MLLRFLKRHTFRQIRALILEEYIGFLLRPIPGYEGMLMRWLLYKMTFKKIGGNALIWPNVFITHSYNIVAGDYLAINYGAHIDGRGGLEIGDNVLIGPNVFIGSSNHMLSPENNKLRLSYGHISKPVKIGSNVWIGANSVICPGVTIGDRSVIAAGSVVTKNITESVVVAGNPAVFIKSLY